MLLFGHQRLWTPTSGGHPHNHKRDLIVAPGLWVYGSCTFVTCSCLPVKEGTWEGGSSTSSAHSRRGRQELLWRQHFLDSTLWWDCRQDKKSSPSPVVRLKAPPLLNNLYKPAWVDAQLTVLDTRLGGPAGSTANATLQDHPGHSVAKVCENGQLIEAVEVLTVLVQTESRVSTSFLYSLLKRCVAEKNLVEWRRVRDLTVKLGYESNAFLCNHILRMYACQGRLKEAMDVFTRVAKPDAFMWFSIISAHAKHGEADQAIQLYHEMRTSGVKPDGHVFVAALKACASAEDLESGRQVHNDVLESGVPPDSFVCSSLVDMYAKCGKLEDARRLFDTLATKNVVTWSAMIAGYAERGRGQEALALYASMEQEGLIIADRVLYICLLKACASVSDLEVGKQLHSQILRNGQLDSDTVVGTCLVDMYGKCGQVEAARRLFDSLVTKNVVTWTAMIAAYAEHVLGQEALALYARMEHEGLIPANGVTFSCLLKACASAGALQQGKQLHSKILEKGLLESDIVVGSCLVDMYAKCGKLEDARRVFDSLPARNVVTWTAMISGYGRGNEGHKAIACFEEMLLAGVQLNETTFTRSSTFICKIRFRNELPDPVTQPKLLRPANIRDQYTKYTISSLEKAYKYKLHVDPDLGIPFDLLDINAYRPPLDPADAELLLDDEILKKDKPLSIRKKERPTDKGVAWLVKTQYISPVSLDPAKQSLTEKQAKELREMKEGRKEFLDTANDREQQIQAIEKSFEIAKQLPVHETKPELKPVEILPLLPDISRWGDQFVHMVFDNETTGETTAKFEVFHRLPHRSIISWTAVISGYTHAGLGKEALRTYHSMRESGLEPPKYIFPILLKACGYIPNLDEGKRIHSEVLNKGWGSDLFIGTALVYMYAKCGSTVDARNAFDGLSQHDVVSWNAILTAYASDSQTRKVLGLYEHMLEEAVCPDRQTFIIVLQACSILAEKEKETLVDGRWIKPEAMVRAKLLHSEAWCKHHGADVFIGGMLVSVYSKSGSITDAKNVFDVLSERHVVAWNTMLLAYVQQSQPENALHLYEQMVEEGIGPDDRTFVSVLHASSMLAEKNNCLLEETSRKEKSLGMGKIIHAEAWKRGYNSNAFVGSTLVSLYSKCGSIVDAEEAFNHLSERDVVAWNTMLAAYAQNGQGEKALQLYIHIRDNNINPNVRTFVSALQACGLLAEKEDIVILNGHLQKVRSVIMAKAIHAEAWAKGHKSNVFFRNTLVSMYGKCGSLVEARIVFDELFQRDVTSWNAMLAAYMFQGYPEKAFELYEEMLQEGTSPNDRTFVPVLQACAMHAEMEEEVVLDGQATKVKFLEKGKVLHVETWWRGYESNVFVASSLISMYGKCGSIVDAANVFDRLSERNVVSWNAMLAVYSMHGQAEKTLELYELLTKEGVNPNNWTFVSLLQACSLLAEMEEHIVEDGHLTKVNCLEHGRAIHAEVQRQGYETDVFVGSALVIMYGKCRSVVDAQKVFGELLYRDLVSWNAMLATYAFQGQGEEAFDLYEQMLRDAVSPDAHTFVSILQACYMLTGKEDDAIVDGQSTKVMGMGKTKAVHWEACKRGYQWDVFVGSTLISSYDKCGSILDAEKVFDGLLKRDVRAWNVMLAAYARQGQGDRAWERYKEMQEDGVTPNEITFVSVLQACSHSGGLDACVQVHQDLISAGNNLSRLLANTLIYVYGRCANMVQAQDVFDTLPQPDEVSWNTLVAGYARQGNTEASLRCYEEMQLAGVQPNGVTFLSLLCACSHAGLVDKGVEYFESMIRLHAITPAIEHYASMADLLGRAGCFTSIEDMLSSMPMQPTPSIWLSLLGACRKHGKVALGRKAFDSAVIAQPEQSAAYILMTSIYSHAGLWDSVKEVNKMRQKAGAWKNPGQTWIGHAQKMHTFVVRDLKHEQRGRLYDLIRELND